MLGVDSGRCSCMEGIVLIRSDLKGLACRLELCDVLCGLVGVGSTFTDLNTVGVSGVCTEENAFLAEANAA